MRVDFRKRLKIIYNRAEKINIEIARYRYLFKYAQRRIENKIVYLTKKFNKKIEKRIICGDIFNNKRENLEIKKRDKKFLTFLLILKF